MTIDNECLSDDLSVCIWNKNAPRISMVDLYVYMRNKNEVKSFYNNPATQSLYFQQTAINQHVDKTFL